MLLSPETQQSKQSRLIIRCTGCSFFFSFFFFKENKHSANLKPKVGDAIYHRPPGVFFTDNLDLEC